MEDTEDSEKPQHKVIITIEFYFGITPCLSQIIKYLFFFPWKNKLLCSFFKKK